MDSTLKLRECSGQRLVGVSRAPLSIMGGQAQVPFPGIPTALSATFIVADELTVKAILGLDFWKLIDV